jgi:hypothetical protein
MTKRRAFFGRAIALPGRRKKVMFVPRRGPLFQKRQSTKGVVVVSGLLTGDADIIRGA